MALLLDRGTDRVPAFGAAPGMAGVQPRRGGVERRPGQPLREASPEGAEKIAGLMAEQVACDGFDAVQELEPGDDAIVQGRLFALVGDL